MWSCPAFARHLTSAPPQLHLDTHQFDPQLIHQITLYFCKSGQARVLWAKDYFGCLPHQLLYTHDKSGAERNWTLIGVNNQLRSEMQEHFHYHSALSPFSLPLFSPLVSVIITTYTTTTLVSTLCEIWNKTIVIVFGTKQCLMNKLECCLHSSFEKRGLQ